MASDLLLQINHAQALLSSSKCNLASASMSVSFAFTENFTLSGASAQSQQDCRAQKTLSRKTESLQMRGIKRAHPCLEMPAWHTPHFIPFSPGECQVFEDKDCVLHTFMSLSCTPLLLAVQSFPIRSRKAPLQGCLLEFSMVMKGPQRCLMC